MPNQCTAAYVTGDRFDPAHPANHALATLAYHAEQMKRLVQREHDAGTGLSAAALTRVNVVTACSVVALALMGMLPDPAQHEWARACLAMHGIHVDGVDPMTADDVAAFAERAVERVEHPPQTEWRHRLDDVFGE